MIKFSDYQFCDDFSFANPHDANMNSNGAHASRAADKLGLMGMQFRRFTQGFIHARQDRKDLVGKCQYYDLGFNAGKN